MGVHNEDKKLVITTEPQTFDFVLPKNVDNNLKPETKHTIKKEVRKFIV